MEKAMKIIRGTKIVAVIGILVVILGLWLPCKGMEDIDTRSERKYVKEYGMDVQPQGIDSWEGQIILVCTILTGVILMSDILAKGCKSEKNIFKTIGNQKYTLVLTVISAIMLILYAALKDAEEVDFYVHVGYFFMWIGEVILAVYPFVYDPKKAEEVSTPTETTEQ